MQLVGVENQDGLVLSWLPDGLQLQSINTKVQTNVIEETVRMCRLYLVVVIVDFAI